ncbi:MAG: T9SS type A sorting domain-containing protein [candidate division WOR-3 bacterium]
MKSIMSLVVIVSTLLSYSWAEKPGWGKEEVVKSVFSSEAGRCLPRVSRAQGVKQPEDTLFYYNMVDNNSIGLQYGGTFEAAIRLTPTELGPYDNWKLTKVRFYHHENISHSGQVKIYDQGTPIQPGALITSQPYTAPSAGWVTVTLSTPVVINSSRDLWVSVEITHSAGQYPISVDVGPAIPEKGDFVYAASLGWRELRTYNLNYNWNIEAIVQMQGESEDPLPPSNLTAYSDYTTPTSISLSWTDPVTRVNGTPLDSFKIEIFRFSEVAPETIFVDSVREGTEAYVDNGLTDGVRYTYLLRTKTYDDSTSIYVSTSWYAGGDPWPAPPTLTAVNVLSANGDTVEVVGIAPNTQRDGTPLDDLAGINIYINNNLVHSFSFTTPGDTFRDTIAVTPGQITVYATAYDNETPVHESDPSNSITVITNVHAGGPDGYGYTFRDSDLPQGPSFIWYDASAGQTISLGDDAYTTLTLPFNFPFYDLTLNTINLCSNGFLSTTPATSYTNYDLPYASIPYLIAFFWDDLNPNLGGTIKYLATPDYAVIHFNNIQHYGGTGTYDMQVILYPNGDIVMSYQTMTGLINSATIGIQGDSGTNNWYLKYTYNGNPTNVHDGLTIYWKRPVRSHDLSIGPIVMPVEIMGLDAFNPTVVVRNIGTSTETNVDVEFRIKKGDTYVYSQSLTISQIDVDEVDTLVFPEFTPSSTGLDYLAEARILFDDDDTTNNYISRTFIIPGLVIDFEADNGGFSIEAGSGWEWGIPASGPGGAHSGQRCWATVLGGDYSNSADWIMYSPLFVATSNAPSFAFFHWYNMEAYTTTAYDGGNIAVKVNDGNYMLVEPRGGYPRSSVVGLGNEPGYSGITAGWELAIFDLPMVNQGDVFRIRFRFGSDASVVRPGWYIDDFMIFGFEVSSVDEQPISGSRVIVGKTNVGKVSLSITLRESMKSEIGIYDISGREVAKLFDGTLRAGKNDLRFDAKLPEGVYFLKVKIGNETSIHKIVFLR